jgi:hypothetical protein
MRGTGFLLPRGRGDIGDGGDKGVAGGRGDIGALLSPMGEGLGMLSALKTILELPGLSNLFSISRLLAAQGSLSGPMPGKEGGEEGEGEEGDGAEDGAGEWLEE